MPAVMEQKLRQLEPKAEHTDQPVALTAETEALSNVALRPNSTDMRARFDRKRGKSCLFLGFFHSQFVPNRIKFCVQDVKIRYNIHDFLIGTDLSHVL